ncbi:MAG: hypothetical protein WCF24_10380 [Acidimicrobiales bacterium]
MIDTNKLPIAERSIPHPGLRRTVLTFSALGAVALLFAACGGSAAGPGVASLGSTTTTTNAAGTANPSPFQGINQEYQYTLSYAECMRTHGMPNFPDPVRSDRGISFNPQADSKSPQFSSANNSCKHLLPDNGGMPTAAQVAAETTKILEWAQCMRTHGLPNFPDPKIISNSHQFGIQLNRVDPNSPQFKTAQKACGNGFGGP